MLPNLAFYTFDFDTVMHYSDLNPMPDSVEIGGISKKLSSYFREVRQHPQLDQHHFNHTQFLGVFCKTAAYILLHLN